MQFNNIRKDEETGVYAVDSLPCPDCGAAPLTVHVDSAQMFKYNMRMNISEVLPGVAMADRERFITGMCASCWDKMAAVFEELEEDGL